MKPSKGYHHHLPYKNDNQYNYYTYIYSIVYLTNYGRLIKTNEIEFFTSYQTINGDRWDDNRCYGANSNNFKIIENNKSYNCRLGSLQVRIDPQNSSRYIALYRDSNKIELIEQPKLLYRIPKLFLDVIDAFHTQNTDLMQKCCKQYLEISRESKVKESIMKDIIIKEIKDEKDMIIKEKDMIIAKKDKEIDDLKIKLEILQQKYDKIKSMFD